MTLNPLPPIGLLSPVVLTLNDVHICESGNYPDKFGQIHKHQLMYWAHNFSNYIPILLEHHPFTWPFFGYVHSITVDGERLLGNMALTKYGVQAVYDYHERHMGSGWSVGILDDKSGLGEVTLCRIPRVSTTHVVTLDNISPDKLNIEKHGIRINGENHDVGDQLVKFVRDIVDFDAQGNQNGVIESMHKLQELMYCNNIDISELSGGK